MPMYVFVVFETAWDTLHNCGVCTNVHTVQHPKTDDITFATISVVRPSKGHVCAKQKLSIGLLVQLPTQTDMPVACMGKCLHDACIQPRQTGLAHLAALLTSSSHAAPCQRHPVECQRSQP